MCFLLKENKDYIILSGFCPGVSRPRMTPCRSKDTIQSFNSYSKNKIINNTGDILDPLNFHLSGCKQFHPGNQAEIFHTNKQQNFNSILSNFPVAYFILYFFKI